MTHASVRRALRRLPALASLPTAVAGCSVLFGGDFDGYVKKPPERDHSSTGGTSSAGAGGAGGTRGGAGGAADGGHDGPDAARDGGSGGDAMVGAHDADATSSDAANEPVDAADGSVDSGPRARPPPGILWSAPVEVCFTTAPHVEWDGARRCSRQTGADAACSGSSFTGVDADALRASLMTLLEDSWGRVSGIQFSGFSDCPSSQEPSADGGSPDGAMMVTFVTRGADPEPLTEAVTGIGKHEEFPDDLHVDWQGLRDRDPEALRAILRETGHVLGFPYEWLRGEEIDAPRPCPADLVRDPDLHLVSRPGSLVDFRSVMDRCTASSDARPGLSPGDAIGAGVVYGTRSSGAIVGFRGHCINVENGNGNLGAAIVADPCRNATNYVFHRNLESYGPSIATVIGHQLRCLQVAGAAPGSAFSPVVSEPCAQSNRQWITTTDLEWRVMGTMCLEARDGAVVLAFCDGSSSQKWNVWDADAGTPLTRDQIQASATGECVAAFADPAVTGDALVLAPCSAADSRQHFTYPEHGIITFDGLCLSVLGGQPAPGSPLVLKSCGSGPSAYTDSTYFSGRFTALGQCLSSRTRTETLEDVGVEQCDTNPSTEVWDFRH